MEFLKIVHEIITEVGSYFFLPLFFFLLGLIARRGARRSAEIAFAVLGSFVGISILISRLDADLLATTNNMIEAYGFSKVAVNTHWLLSSAITYTSKLIFYMIPLGILVNALLVLMKVTRVVNLDLWSLWQVAFVGTMVERLTGSFWYGLVSAVLLTILQLLIADVFQPQASTLLGAQHITMSQSFAAGFAPISWGVNRLIDLIPAFRGKRLAPEETAERWGFWGEPAFWGFVVALIFGIASKTPIYNSIEFALVLAGCLYILPRLLRVLADAVSSVTVPLAERALKNKVRKTPLKFSISAMAGIASPTVLLTAVIMVPISVVLGEFLPGNLVLPSGDIAILLYMMVFVVALSGRCLIRSLISGVVSVVAMLYCGTVMTQLFTDCAAAADAAFGNGLYNSLCNASNPLTFLTVEGASFGLAGVAALAVITLGLMFLAARKIRRENNALAQGSPSQTPEA